MAEPIYRRVVIKLSGEYLAGVQSFGLDQPILDRIAGDLIAARELGAEIAVVVGGGNIVRGVEVSSRGVSPADRRYHGHARHRDELPRARGRDRTPRRARAHAVGVCDAADFGTVYPQRHAPVSRRRADRAARRRNRQSLLHHRYHRGVARGRNRRAGGAEGHQRRWHLQRRSQEGSIGKTIRPFDAFRRRSKAITR